MPKRPIIDCLTSVRTPKIWAARNSHYSIGLAMKFRTLMASGILSTAVLVSGYAAVHAVFSLPSTPTTAHANSSQAFHAPQQAHPSRPTQPRTSTPTTTPPTTNPHPRLNNRHETALVQNDLQSIESQRIPTAPESELPIDTAGSATAPVKPWILVDGWTPEPPLSLTGTGILHSSSKPASSDRYIQSETSPTDHSAGDHSGDGGSGFVSTSSGGGGGGSNGVSRGGGASRRWKRW